jgi:tetratricopeptide (TPR) repeat protein
VITAIPSRTLRRFACLALLAALAGCQTDSAPFAQSESASNAPSVLQLASAEVSANQGQAVESNAAALDGAALGQELPAAEERAETTESAALLEPPQSLETQDDAASAPAPSASETDNLKLSGVDAYLEVARLAHQRGLTALSEKYYLKALHAYPDAAVAWNDLGQFYLVHKEYSKATSAARMAVSLEPKSRRYHNNLGEMLVRAGQLDEGLREFEVAVGPAAAHYNAAVVLHDLGKRAESIQHLRLAVAKDPNLREAQLALKQVQPTARVAARRSAAPPSTHRLGTGSGGKTAVKTVSPKPAANGKTFTNRLRELFRPRRSAGEDTRTAERSHDHPDSHSQPRRGFFSFLQRDRTDHAH